MRNLALLFAFVPWATAFASSTANYENHFTSLFGVRTNDSGGPTPNAPYAGADGTSVWRDATGTGYAMIRAYDSELTGDPLLQNAAGRTVIVSMRNDGPMLGYTGWWTRLYSGVRSGTAAPYSWSVGARYGYFAKIPPNMGYFTYSWPVDQPGDILNALPLDHANVWGFRFESVLWDGGRTPYTFGVHYAAVTDTPRKLGGTVTLGGFEGFTLLQPTFDRFRVILELRPAGAPGTDAPFESIIVDPFEVLGTGSFEGTICAPPGQWDVYAVAYYDPYPEGGGEEPLRLGVAPYRGTWLKKKISNVTITETGANGLDFTLANGDITGDGMVNLDDFLVLAAYYEVQYDPWNDAELDTLFGGHDPFAGPIRADLDRLLVDGAYGRIDLDDFLILAANYETMDD